MPFVTTFTPQSSQVELYQYDWDTETLRVWFRKGGVYEYYPVEDALYDEIANWESFGKWLDTRIKKAGKPYVKVTDPGPKPEKPAPKIDTTFDDMNNEEYLAKIAEANRQ